MAPVSNINLIVSFGEMWFDFLPSVSGFYPAEALGMADFIGKLGDDEFGHMLADILKKNGISADVVNFNKGARTALAFMTIRSDREREFMF